MYGQNSQVSRKGIVWRIVVAVLLVLISLFPSAYRIINDEPNVLYKIIGILMAIGLFFLKWWLLCVVLLFIILISCGAYKLLVEPIAGKEEDINKGGMSQVIGISLTATFLIIIVYQFLSNWLIDPGMIGTVFNFLFPPYTPLI